MNPDVEYAESPAKKRKLTQNGTEWRDSSPLLYQDDQREDRLLSSKILRRANRNHHDAANISISPNPRLTGQTVAPFLIKHIPNQYAPSGGPSNANASTKYCYRHRPDLKCRRQADEPSMDQLQHVCYDIAYQCTLPC